MKLKVLKVLLLNLLAGALLQPGTAQAPIKYSIARTDNKTTQLSVINKWGPTGLGQKFCNKAFNGLCIVRLTDSTTNNKTTLQTASTGEPQLATLDGHHVIVHSPLGASLIQYFNPLTEVVQNTPLRFNYITLQASSNDVNVLFALDKTRIHKITIDGMWTKVVSDVVIFDYATVSCLGAGFVPSWIGTFTIVGNPEVFKTSFSITGAQGSGIYTAVWSQLRGCTTLNTLTGTVTVQGTILGTVDNESRFYIHDAGGGNNANYAEVEPTGKQPNGKPGCIAGDCSHPFFWQIGTTNLVSCGGVNSKYYCDGHTAKLPSIVLSGRNFTEHLWSDPSKPLTSLGKLSNQSPDNHPSSNNGADLNGPPLFIGTQAIPSPKRFPTWGYNEILYLMMDGSKVVGRVNQTGNSGASPYFVCQSAIINVFPQGNYVLFTSDMGGHGALGFEADGKTSRCDVFVSEVR